MFRSYASHVKFKPEDGMSVILRGKVSLYEKDGLYQFYAEEMYSAGVGDLSLKFEQIKAKLQEEGLFDSDSKISDAIVPSAVGRGDGYSIIISDFLTDDNYEAAIDRFAEQRRDVLCVQVLAREELNPQLRGKMHLFDSESPSKFFRKKIDQNIINAYKEALKYVTDRIRSYTESRGGHYMLMPAYMEPSELFFDKFVNMGVLK